MKKTVLFFLFILAVSVGRTQQEDTLKSSLHFYYLADKSYTELLNLFVNQKIAPIDNHITFLVLDSIVSSREATGTNKRLEAMQYMINRSDGALSEVMGIYLFDYMKNKPKEFHKLLHKAKKDSAFERSVLSLCAFEIYASEEDVLLSEAKTVFEASTDLTSQEKELLLAFLKKIKATSILLE